MHRTVAGHTESRGETMSTKTKSPAKRLFIVDDHPMMRTGMAQLIGNEPDLIICGESGTAGQAFDMVTSEKPDLLLLDISLPDKNGLELIKDLLNIQPALPILVVSMHDEMLYAERVLRAGARGYIMKQEGGKKLLQAIRQILGGQIYVSEKMASRILEAFSGKPGKAAESALHLLSDREFEVFQCIGRGLGTQDIARQLHLSVKTVWVHRINIKKKLGLETANDLVHYAVRWAETEKET
jgi:DNA-binding NarL/FixJ family response regulator